MKVGTVENARGAHVSHERTLTLRVQDRGRSVLAARGQSRREPPHLRSMVFLERLLGLSYFLCRKVRFGAKSPHATTTYGEGSLRTKQFL
jgi:hypothetical protein